MGSDDYLPPTRFESPESPKSFALSGRIMLSAVIILFFVVVLMVALHLYARWYLIRARRRQLLRRRSRLAEARRVSQFVFYADNNPTTIILTDPANRGLEYSVLNSLPVFVFSSKTHPEPLDCAVCLSEFEENDKGRRLPNCNHSFHIECIDMWFRSHSTCPLCRTPVEPVTQPQNCMSGLCELERTGNEPSDSNCDLCVACEHEDGNTSTASLGSRRKGIDVRIEVPVRNGLEEELALSSPAGGGQLKSPGGGFLAMKMKKILSMGGRKTPASEGSRTPSGAGTSGGSEEFDLEKGLPELSPR